MENYPEAIHIFKYLHTDPYSIQYVGDCCLRGVPAFRAGQEAVWRVALCRCRGHRVDGAILPFSCSIVPASPKEWGETHTHTELPGMLQSGGLQ